MHHLKSRFSQNSGGGPPDPRIQHSCRLFSKRNTTFFKLPFFWRECIPVKLGLYIIKTLCQGQWPRGTRENWQFKVMFLLKKSVMHFSVTSKYRLGQHTHHINMHTWCAACMWRVLSNFFLPLAQLWLSGSAPGVSVWMNERMDWSMEVMNH